MLAFKLTNFHFPANGPRNGDDLPGTHGQPRTIKEWERGRLINYGTLVAECNTISVSYTYTKVMSLDAVQEHYLKRELLKFQLDKEFELLNNKDGLRHFGYPFTSEDPRLQIKKGESYGTAISNALWSSATYFTGSGSGEETKVEEEAAVSILPRLEGTQYPLLSYMLQEFIFSFPLLSKNLSVDERFWQGKVQVFFEHFMSMGFSDSYDREETTKRRKMGQKMKKVIMLLFNSGIGTTLESSYYEHDKLTAQQENTRKRSNIEELTMPTKENLKFLVTHEPVYFNTWDISIISVYDSSKASDELSNTLTKNNSSNSSSSSSIHSSSSYLFKSKDLKKTSAYTSKMFKSAFGAASSTTSNMFSKLSGSTVYSSTPESKSYLSVNSNEKNGVRSKKSKYYFVIRTRRLNEPDAISYNFKTYNSFKKFSHRLKKEFPSKKLPDLPSKKQDKKALRNIKKEQLNNKTDQPNISSLMLDDSNSKDTDEPSPIDDNSMKDDLASNISSDDQDLDLDTQSIDSVEEETKFLPYETLRYTLRLYLRTLSKDSDVVQSSIWKEFFKEDVVDPETFDESLMEDIKLREITDIKNLENQISFQKMALEKTVKLQASMKDFKTNLLEDEKYLLELVGEIKAKKRFEDLSPSLQNFVEWCKIYLSSILYQMFLGNDNSYEFYRQIRRLHKLLPYTVMCQIMRFTNPVAIMKGMIDLFMAQPFGGQSLLQTMFSTILTEDIKHQKNAVKELERKVLSKHSDSKQMLAFLRSCIFQDDSSNPLKFNDIQEESELMQMPVCLLLIMKGSEAGKIKKDVVAELINSYSSWKSEQGNELQPSGEGNFYVNVHDLMKLYIKEHDKRLMRQLWQDPELQQLLKAIISLIYEPMLRIFKVARMDLAIKNFEKFMDDLVQLMDDVIAKQLHISSKFNIVESILDLVNKHQNSFLEFLHDVYNRDSEGIFEGFITWISKIIRFLQKSKFGSPEERVDLNDFLNTTTDHLDKDLLLKQINEVIKKKIDARKVYWQILEEKISKKENTRRSMSPEVMENNWKTINSMIIPTHSDSFGVQDNDMIDLDIEMTEHTVQEETKETELDKEYRNILSRTIDESEIEKLCGPGFDDLLRLKLSTYKV